MTAARTTRTPSPLAEITEVAHITTKQDLSAWTRAHADAPGITWSVLAGPGGTMVIIDRAPDRPAAPAQAPTAALEAA